MAKLIEIRKYANRRLYDINKKNYITLDKVKDYVQANYKVKITDVVSGKDVTHSCLLQIVIETEDKGKGVFSQHDLESIIKAYGSGDKFISNVKSEINSDASFDSALDMVMNNYKKLSNATHSVYCTWLDCSSVANK